MWICVEDLDFVRPVVDSPGLGNEILRRGAKLCRELEREDGWERMPVFGATWRDSM